MSEILTTTIDTIKSLPATLRALLLVILIAVAGFLAYTQMSAPAEEAPATVNKEATVGNVGEVTGGFNITQ